jgi:hypothetical protein
LSSNTASNTMEAMELGDSTTAERDRRSAVDEALDRFDAALTDLINTVETGGLDRLEADQQLAVWHRFERLRNKLPLVDHRLITHADAADLPRQYCSATMTQFLVRILQLNTDGLPEWIPPRWIDQDQRPHINTRIQRIHTQQRLHRRNRQRRTPTAG